METSFPSANTSRSFDSCAVDDDSAAALLFARIAADWEKGFVMERLCAVQTRLLENQRERPLEHAAL